MAEVKYNATLENKVNTIVLTHHDELGNETEFDADTTMYVSHLGGADIDIDPDNSGVNGRVLSETGSGLYSRFVARVDLSNETINVNTDYDHPTYEHSYSVRSPHKVYMYGKLNIVNIA